MARVRWTRSQRAEAIEELHAYSINCETRELWIQADAGLAEDGVTWASANTFIKNLRFLQSLGAAPILVHQCSCGGDWNYGIAIYDAIKASKAQVAILAHAHARSMSSIIPQAAKLRLIMPNADFLIHFGSLEVGGDAKSAIAEAKWCEQLNERMLDLYASRCARGPYFRRRKWSRERIKQHYLIPTMDEKREVYMDAYEAVDKGFMDAVVGTRGYENLEAVHLGVAQLGRRKRV